jgi:hypothetical protein
MSRRFKGRHVKAHAFPEAEPDAAVVLDDSNSHADTFFPDIRYANQLNTRAYVKAGEDEEQLSDEKQPDGSAEL